jgi:hypothetical protein
LCSKIHKLTNYILNKEGIPQQWKDSIILLIYKKADEAGCMNYLGISFLSTSYRVLCNIIVSRLSPNVNEVTSSVWIF